MLDGIIGGNFHSASPSQMEPMFISLNFIQCSPLHKYIFQIGAFLFSTYLQLILTQLKCSHIIKSNYLKLYSWAATQRLERMKKEPKISDRDINDLMDGGSYMSEVWSLSDIPPCAADHRKDVAVVFPSRGWGEDTSYRGN